MKKFIAPALLYALAGFLLLGFLQSNVGISAASIIALALGVVLPAGVATRMLLRPGAEQRLEQRQHDLRMRTVEAEILRISKAHDGKVTLIEIVSELAVSPEDAKAAVDSLVRQELGDIEITDSGVLVYVFRDIRHLHEKPQAKGLLE